MKKTTQLLPVMLTTLLFFACGNSNTKTKVIEETINFGSITDSITHFKTLNYGKDAKRMYKWTSSYLNGSKTSMDITLNEYNIQITAVRNIYSKKLNKEINGILSSKNCNDNSKKRKKLTLELKEMLAYNNLNKGVVKNLQANYDDINLQNKIIYYAYSTSTQVSLPYDIKDATYDYEYPTQRIQEANRLLKSYKYNCTLVKNTLKRVKAKLNERHKNYLTHLVDLYVSQTEYDYNTDAKVTSEIDKYFYANRNNSWAYKYGTSKDEATSFTNGLVERMETFKNDKNEENEQN